MRFVTDKIIKGKPYPALAVHQARPYTPSWRQFGQHWPYTVPAELFGHMDDHDFPYTLDDSLHHGWYVIALGFFDFSIDYILLLPDIVIGKLRTGRIKLLFYYHEGDNPASIKQRLDYLCELNHVDSDCYVFVSGNTRANSINNFAWFPDHELLYWRRNKNIPPIQQHTGPRPNEFLALNRTHKWWRATAMADLVQSKILDNSLWSYNTLLDLGESRTSNPIQESIVGANVDQFIAQGPYTCDNQNADEHNDHSVLVPEHWTQTYCSIVFETHFDADGSNGSFITEKTFKAIKHGHPFVIVGCAGTLSTLRDLGYKTFDNEIDTTYDSVTDNTQRWQLIKNAIQQIQKQNMQTWYQRCRSDIEHNQKLFAASKHDRLSKLFSQLKII